MQGGIPIVIVCIYQCSSIHQHLSRSCTRASWVLLSKITSADSTLFCSAAQCNGRFPRSVAQLNAAPMSINFCMSLSAAAPFPDTITNLAKDWSISVCSYVQCRLSLGGACINLTPRSDKNLEIHSPSSTAIRILPEHCTSAQASLRWLKACCKRELVPPSVSPCWTTYTTKNSTAFLPSNV